MGFSWLIVYLIGAQNSVKSELWPRPREPPSSSGASWRERLLSFTTWVRKVQQV